MESAASLLQSVKEDNDTTVAQKKKNGAGVLFGRGSPSSSRKLSGNNKRYVKMGILLSDSPAEVSPYRSHHHGNTGISSPSGTHTPPFSGERKVTDSASCPVSHSTSPVNQSSFFSNQCSRDSSHSVSPSRVSSSPSTEEVAVSIRPYMEDNGGHSDSDVKAEGYEVIDLKDIGSIVDKTERSTVAVQPSPPISMKSESTSINSEEPMSSPDSGYGNTPEYPNPNANGEVKPGGEPRRNGMDLHDGQGRHGGDDVTDGVSRKESVEKAKGMETANGFSSGNGELLLRQQAGLNGEQLSRQSRGSSSSAVVSDSESRGQRSRGNTDESLFSAESLISSPDGAGLSSRGGEDTQVFTRQRAKLYLGRQNSIPAAAAAGIDERKSPTTLRGHPVGPLRHQTGQFHMSPSTGSLSSSVRASSSPHRYSQPVMSSPLGFSELHPSHPSHPSRAGTSTLPHSSGSGDGSRLPPSQSFHHIQRRSPESRRKVFRSSSIAFTKSAGRILD